MKRAWHKICQYEILCDYLLFCLLVLVSGGLLIVQIAKIAGNAALTISSTRFTVIFVMAFLAVVLLVGFSLYKKSVSYILWYKEIFNSIPMPLIVTGEDAGWLQVNKATREAMNLKGKRSIEDLNSRHLVNEDGSVKSKIWLHNGKNYKVSGKRLRCGGKYEGYLIFLNGAAGTAEAVAIQAETLGKVNGYIQRISAEAEYLRGCTKNISGHMVWQSNMITDLLEIIDGMLSGGLKDPEALNERICTVKANIQRHTENGQADLERMQRMARDLKDTDDLDGNDIFENDTA